MGRGRRERRGIREREGDRRGHAQTYSLQDAFTLFVEILLTIETNNIKGFMQLQHFFVLKLDGILKSLVSLSLNVAEGLGTAGQVFVSLVTFPQQRLLTVYDPGGGVEGSPGSNLNGNQPEQSYPLHPTLSVRIA